MNFAKFLRTPILSNKCERLLLYIAKLMSSWRNVCLYAIYYPFIWLNYARSTKTEEIFLIHLRIHNKICWILTTHWNVSSLSHLIRYSLFQSNFDQVEVLPKIHWLIMHWVLLVASRMITILLTVQTVSATSVFSILLFYT